MPPPPPPPPLLLLLLLVVVVVLVVHTSLMQDAVRSPVEHNTSTSHHSYRSNPTSPADRRANSRRPQLSAGILE